MGMGVPEGIVIGGRSSRSLPRDWAAAYNLPMAMDYAIVETGGKQYRVKEGDSITVEKLAGDEGSRIELDKVLLVSKDAAVTVGQPTVDGAKVVAEVTQQGKANKVIVFKYKSKIRYHVKNGHRQQVTKLSIKQILSGGEKPAAPRRRRRTTDGA